MKKFIFIFLFTFFLINCANAANLQSIADDYLQNHKFNEHISGVALRIQQKGTQASANVGNVSFNTETKINADSIFQIGSITKSFVAVVLLQLQDDTNYKFSIDDDLRIWFPEYPQWHGIKVRQLLNMTSGIPDYSEDPTFVLAALLSPFKNWRLEEILNYEVNKRLHFPPGSGWEYSNTNYTLLGLLIRRITGNEPRVEITERIIKKLDLKNTFYIDDQPYKSLNHRLVHGYAYLNGDYIDTTGYSLSSANTSGAIISTTEDMNQFVNALFGSNQLLTPAQFSQLTAFVSEKTGQPIKEPTQDEPNVYGLGVVGSFSEKDGIEYVYEGSNPGFRFVYSYNPKSALTVIAGLNSDKQGKEWELLEAMKVHGKSLNLKKIYWV